MAYQAPSIWYRDQKGLGSEDWKTGIETQDKTETLRRKNALADAFSKSIVTEPIIADHDIYDANGNRTQSKGDILARPGDVDQQKFFKHSAEAGLGFDEARAVYDHYDMQKKAALNSIKTGLEIQSLGGGTGVDSRAGAPIITDTINPQEPAPAPAPAPAPTVPKAAEPISSPLAKELDGKTDYEKVNKLQQWMNSKKADKIRAAQAIVGAKIDGRMGNETKTAFGAWKDRVIKSNLGKDETTGTQNRVDIIASLPSTVEGKLSVDDAFDSQPSKFGSSFESIPDTRTQLQVIEDTAAKNKFGQTQSSRFDLNAPKLKDFGTYQSNVESVLSKNGLDVSDEGIKQHLQNAADSIPDFKYDIGKSASENRIIEAKIKADKQAAVNKAREGLASGVDTVKGQAIASSNHGMAKKAFNEDRTPARGLESYGIKGLNPEETNKAVADLTQFQLGQSIKKSTSELLKKSGNMTPDELSNAVKQPIMMMAQIEGAGNEKQEEGLMAGLRQDKGLAAILDKNKGKSAKEQIAALSISKLTSQQQSKFLKLLDDYADDIVKNGKARNALETKAKITGGKFDPTGGEGSGAAKGLGKGLKPKTTGGKRKATLEDF